MPTRKLPTELEREIFLLVPHQTVHTCLSVAKRVKVWLEPILYRVVCLTTNVRARAFLRSIFHRPYFALSRVEVICLNMSVSLDTGTSILALCAGVKSLNMRFPCHLIGRNPILVPLENLQRLENLHVDLSTIFNTRVIYLPDVGVFHRVTHLHLTNAWATWYPAANSIGLEQLTQITHLSLFLSTIRTLPGLLRKILNRENLVVLVLWKRFSLPDSAAMRFLTDSGIDDKRILLLDERLFRNHMLDSAFWAAAERLVKLRLGMEASFHGDVDLLMLYTTDQVVSGFHPDTEWKVKTDVESSDSGDESGEESESNEEQE